MIRGPISAAMYSACSEVLSLHDFMFLSVTGMIGGPITAVMYSACSEVLLGQHVPGLYSIFRVGVGTAAIIGPTITGKCGPLTIHFSSFQKFYSVMLAVNM